MLRWILLPILISLFIMPLTAIQAQSPPSDVTICALAYEDQNRNGVRDSGEMSLPGISVNLADENSVIFRTMITSDEPDPPCFENLTPATYELTFAESPNHVATTGNIVRLPLDAGQRVRLEFGAVPQNPIVPETEASARLAARQENVRLATGERVLIALAAAVIVMIFMVGFGAVVVSVIY